MNDDQLRDQLERRANGGAVPDLLSSISARLDVRQLQPTRVARWAPLAGLTAAAVIVLALVVAFPGGVVTSKPTTSSSLSPTLLIGSQIATASAVRTYQQSLQPTAGVVSPSFIEAVVHTCSSTITVADSTGGVASCTDRGGGDYHTAKFGVAGDTDPHLIHLTWLEDCQTSYRISVTDVTSAGTSGFQIATVPTSFDPSCFFSPDARFVDIEFDRPTDATAVSLDVGSGGVSCDRLGDFNKDTGNVAIRDGTSLITSCVQVPSTETGDPSDSAANVQPNQVRVDWTDYEGPDLELTLNQLSGHYELTGGESCNSCPYARFEAVITFANPIDASSIWLGLSGEPPAPPTTFKGTGNVPVTNIDFTGDFALSITSTKWVYSTDEAIDVQAALSYTGTDPSVELSGSGGGLVVFGIQQLDGNLAVDGVRNADCQVGGYSLTPGNAMNIPFAKTGGFDASGPNAQFYKSYFSDPQLHLPLGRWQIYAASDFSVGSTCTADDVRMKATIEIEVDGNQVTSLSNTPPS